MLRTLACIAFTTALVLGFDPLSGGKLQRPAFAQSEAEIKAIMLKSSLLQMEHWMSQAKTGVENGEWHGAACKTVLSKAFGIIKSFPEDEEAIASATAAIDSCTHELPVTHFHQRLDAIEAIPGDGSACEIFISEAQDIFWTVALIQGPLVVADYESNSSDEERRFKAALSERVNQVCPEQATANGY